MGPCSGNAPRFHPLSTGVLGSVRLSPSHAVSEVEKPAREKRRTIPSLPGDRSVLYRVARIFRLNCNLGDKMPEFSLNRLQRHSIDPSTRTDPVEALVEAVRGQTPVRNTSRAGGKTRCHATIPDPWQ